MLSKIVLDVTTRMLKLLTAFKLRPQTPKWLYRTLTMEEYRLMTAEGKLKSKNPTGSVSVREHVFRGSSQAFAGSQYISTTSDLEIAVKYAAPFYPIIRIDFKKFHSHYKGNIINLSDEYNFEAAIPREQEDERNGSVYRDSYVDTTILARKMMNSNESNRFTDIQDNDIKRLRQSATASKWESLKLFAIRSKEYLLVGEIPGSCISLVEYVVKTNKVHQLPTGIPVPLSCLSDLILGLREGGANSGLLNCKLKDNSGDYLCKVAKPNIEPFVLTAERMRHSINSEFTAFSVYRIVETYGGTIMQIAVRDCAKIDFEVFYPSEYEDEDEDDIKINLNCLVFRQLPDSDVKSVKIDWHLTPNLNLNIKIQSKKNIKTGKQVKERGLKNNCSIRNPKDYISYQVTRHITKKHLNAVYQGMLMDIILGNLYGWGIEDKSFLVHDKKTNHIIRLSAESALGNEGIEHLNFDREEPAVNVALQTLNFQSLYNTKIPIEIFYINLMIQLDEIDKLYESHSELFEESFHGLGLPSNLLRLAENVSCLWSCKYIPSVIFWDGFVKNRIKFMKNEVFSKPTEPSKLQKVAMEFFFQQLFSNIKNNTQREILCKKLITRFISHLNSPLLKLQIMWCDYSKRS